MRKAAAVTMEHAALPRMPPLRSDSIFDSCIFCHGNVALKKMGDIYIRDGEDEDYEYMLHTCFGMKVPGSREKGGRLICEKGGRLICEECVRRLRAALSFRRLVAARDLLPARSLSTGDDASDPSPPGMQKRPSNNQNSLRCKTSYTSSLTMRPKQNANCTSKHRQKNQSIRSVSRVASYLHPTLATPADPRCGTPVPRVQCRICRTAFRLPNARKLLSKTEMRTFICRSCLKVLKPNQLTRSISAGAKKSAGAKCKTTVVKSASMTPKRGAYFRTISHGKTGSGLIDQKPSGSVKGRSASQMSQFGCQVCGKVFRSTKTLDFHMRKHVGQPMFQCRQCPKLYRDKQILARHMQVKHG